MEPTTNLWPFCPVPSRSLATALLGFALAGCATAPEARLERDACAAPASAPGAIIDFVGGPGTSARVRRVVAPDGSETLHGETELSLGATTRRCIVEDVSLDAHGRLLRADISAAASCDAEPETRAHLEPAVGIARVATRAASGLRSWTPAVAQSLTPSSTPWIYTPEALPGRAATTPVAAWVALRAAALSPLVRLVQLERREAWLVPREQVAVPTELGTTVVLGNDGADVGSGFVERIRMTDIALTLVRVPTGGEASI
jgi:hypothetical protein